MGRALRWRQQVRHFTDVDGELVAAGRVDADRELDVPEAGLGPVLCPGHVSSPRSDSADASDLAVYRFCHDP